VKEQEVPTVPASDGAALSDRVPWQCFAAIHGIEAIVNTIKHNISPKGDVAIFARACLALCALTRKNTTSVKRAIDADAANLVIQGLAVHIENELAQAHGCAALFSLSYPDDMKQLVADGAGSCLGLEAVLLSMAQHPDSPQVHTWAHAALGNMAVLENLSYELANRGIALHRSLDRHSTAPALFLSPSCVEAACGLLGNLAFQDDLAEMFIGLNIVPALSGVLRHYLTNAMVVEEACSALKNLSHIVEATEQFLELEGIELTLEALRLHEDQEATVGQLLGIWVLLTQDEEEVASKLVEQGESNTVHIHSKMHTQNGYYFGFNSLLSCSLCLSLSCITM